jgi:hypothetical protein
MDFLPTEMILKIYLDLNMESILRLCSVSKKYRSLYKDQSIWTELLKRDIGIDCSDTHLFKAKTNYDIYIIIYMLRLKK